MRVAVQKTVPPAMARTWGSEPNDRATVKMGIAEAMGRIARTRDQIAWREELMPDGSLTVTGVIDMGGPIDERLPDYVLSLDQP